MTLYTMRSNDWLFSFSEGLKFRIPYSQDWVHLDGNIPYYLTFGSCFLYIAFLLVIPYFKPSTEKSFKSFSTIHYGLLCIYSLIAFGSTFWSMFANGEFTDIEKFYCTPVPDWLRWISISFTISKMWEWFDTAILLWSGKTFTKIGFLHLYHHFTTFFLFLHIMNFPGTEKSGLLMNGFVHTLMYYHFAWRLPKAFRPLITFAQILQLSSATFFHAYIPHECPEYSTFPKDYPFEYLVPYSMVPVYCLFFIKFFYEQYIATAPKKQVKSE